MDTTFSKFSVLEVIISPNSSIAAAYYISRCWYRTAVS